MSEKLITVLTVRTNSHRLPNKALTEIDGRPLISWIIQRLKRLPGDLIMAIPEDKENENAFTRIAANHNVMLVQGDPHDVVTRITDAIRLHYPDANYVFRALGDCPFIDDTLVRRSIVAMKRTNREAFVWHLEPQTWPVYGAREFPFSIVGWRRIHLYSTNREHPDMYFHNHRQQFRIIYHEPPDSIFFRPYYRLEVDWPEDIQLVHEIAAGVGMDAPLTEVIRFLDANNELCKINRERVEHTGPTVSYDHEMRRRWMREMRGQPVMRWDDTILTPPSPKAMPIYCKSGKCLVGYGWRGTLHTDNAQISGKAFIKCRCGSGKYWNDPIRGT